MSLRAPFPWFGGKSRCADLVWQAFGNVPNYIEPFFGSGAVLLSRPHEPKIETVNDKDAYIANFWRAVQAEPDAVAKYSDWPVNEADLHARHAALLAALPAHRERTLREPEYFDARAAGWWVWGLSMWIGSGWCMPPSAKAKQWLKRPVLGHGGHGGRGVVAPGTGKPSRKMPDLYTRGDGRGIRSAAPEKKPRLSSRINGRASPRIQIPALQGGGRGVTAPSRLPNLGSERGVLGADAPPCTEWFRMLQDRLRRVRVCCGDWTRVLGDSVTGLTRSRNSGMNPCGIFLDPPYSGEHRDELYTEDSLDISKDVANWARKHGGDPDVRIALCGYEGEHVMPGWTCIEWKALRGYGNDENENRHRERIWLSPHCLPLVRAQGDLFAIGDAR